VENGYAAIANFCLGVRFAQLRFYETGALVRKQDYLETREVPIGEGENNIHLYVRLKQQ